MRRAPAYEGAVAPDPVISHLSATVDRAARWRRVVFRTSLAGACVLIAMLAMMILADTAYGGWIEDLTGLSISGIVNNFFTALGLGDGVAAIMQSASDTWLSQLASYKFDVDASRVATSSPSSTRRPRRWASRSSWCSFSKGCSRRSRRPTAASSMGRGFTSS